MGRSGSDRAVADVWQSLQGVVARVPGWSPSEELFALYALGLLTAPLGGDILEIGSWCGRSTIALAWACRDSGVGVVHACDLFPARDDWFRNADGTWSFSVEIGERRLGAYQSQTVWDEPYRRDIEPLYREVDSIRELFDRCLGDAGAADWVRVLQGDAGMFLEQHKEASTMVRLAFIDGDHGYQAVCRDIAVAEDCLVEGGWIAFDDAFTSYDGVDRAIQDKVLDSGRYECGVQFSRKLFAARKRGAGAG